MTLSGAPIGSRGSVRCSRYNSTHVVLVKLNCSRDRSAGNDHPRYYGDQRSTYNPTYKDVI